jgi:hypothetical protein
MWRERGHWDCAQKGIGDFSLELLVDLFAEPVEPLVESIARRCAGSLDLPDPVGDRVEPETIPELLRLDRVWQILLVSSHIHR